VGRLDGRGNKSRRLALPRVPTVGAQEMALLYDVAPPDLGYVVSDHDPGSTFQRKRQIDMTCWLSSSSAGLGNINVGVKRREVVHQIRQR
jgi:hypothetical protein